MAVEDLSFVPVEQLVLGRRRARTVSVTRLPKYELERGRAAFPPDPEMEAMRPKTYGDCDAAGWGLEGQPCPWVSCAMHLALDVDADTGNIKENFPGVELEAMRATCALRVAAREGVTLEEVGEYVNLTRERVRQLEGRALATLARLNAGLLAKLHESQRAPANDQPEAPRPVGRPAVTHCHRGHPLAGDNLFVWQGRRQCRACINERQRARRAARKHVGSL